MNKFLITFAVILLTFSECLAQVLDTSACRQGAHVLDENENYVKSACVVGRLLKQDDARAFCRSKGMYLFKRTSSSATKISLSAFISEVGNLKSNKKFIIARENNICKVITGAGRTENANCGTRYEFICEYIDKSGILPTPGECGVNTMSRIEGGVDAGIREFPWMARVIETNNADSSPNGYFCGAVLISKRYVLTAATCVKYNMSTTSASVALGEYNIQNATDCVGTDCSDGPINVDIELITVIKNGDRYKDDIALLRLARDITFTDFIKPICLPVDRALRNLDLAGKNATIAGWGDTGSSPQTSNLIKLDVTAVSNQNCSAHTNMTDSQICAFGAGPRHLFCGGDQGGPMMRLNTAASVPYWYLTGILSRGKTQCGSNGTSPDIYTRVSFYYDWIVQNLRV